ncbi:Fic family protein [Aeromonas dhakensis]|uniref:Fic family protein n=1 Tax=Aeromonas dhakensis TaxID=196024 RepID=UPI00227B4F03|nr:Fic family protein [Aeromonas dhakensis]WAG00062.1 Fic family protein [Aeromonas dhakensis]
MIRHIKVDNVESITESPYKILHIKKVDSKNGSINVYWNRARSEILTGRMVHLPVPSIAHVYKWKGAIDDTSRKDVQIGDSVIYILGAMEARVVCATVVGYHQENKKGIYKDYVYIEANNEKDINPAARRLRVPLVRARFVFVSNNLKPRKLAEKNIIAAYYQDELSLIESLYSYVRIPIFIEYKLQLKQFSINKSLLLECHRELFRDIYSWAGVIRTHEVVVAVGRREHPTLDAEKIDIALDEFFTKQLPSKTGSIRQNKENLASLLTIIHANLAFIHPFEDGNGRSIRLFLKLISFKLGYKLKLDERTVNKRQKRYYHYSVGRAVKHELKHLYNMIYLSLEKIK